MRTPIFRITNDDDPSDYTFPVAVSLPDLWDTNAIVADQLPRPFPVGASFTVGGGASPEFTLTRIR